MLVETDRDKYCVEQIVDFYHRQDTDYADYFLAAWRFKHRAALGKPEATLADFAAARQSQPQVPGDGLGHARGDQEDVGPIAGLANDVAGIARARSAISRSWPGAGCDQMRDFVVEASRRSSSRDSRSRRDGHQPHGPAVSDVEEPRSTPPIA